MKKLTCLTILIVFAISMRSQTLLSNIGGVMKNSQVSVSYAIGESCIQLYHTQNATIAQGFEQYVSTTTTAVTETKDEALLFIYQSTGYINYYHVPIEKNYQYSLVSMSGQEIQKGYLNGEPINATTIYSGTYLIIVKTKQQQIGIYKILIY